MSIPWGATQYMGEALANATAPYRAAFHKWGEKTEAFGDRQWDSWGRRVAVNTAVNFLAPGVGNLLGDVFQPGPGVRYRWDQNLITPSVARSIGRTATRTLGAMANFHNRTPRVYTRPTRTPFVRYRYQGGGFGPKPKWKQFYQGRQRRPRSRRFSRRRF